MFLPPKPRRSILYMPGSNMRALEKGKTLPADGLILDLEDSVAPEAKETARRQVMDALARGGYGPKELIVRVNALDSPWGEDDLRALAGLDGASCPDGVLIPKVESASMVTDVLACLERAGGLKDLAIWTMMETPKGVLNAREIAFSSPLLAALVMGTSDLAKDLHCAHTRDRLPLAASLGLCLLAGRAAGLSVIDGVFLDLDDDEGFRHACKQGRDFGFDGKTLIHPKTIEAANAAFAPSAEEVAWSQKVIAAHAEAERQGRGVTVVDGKLVENLHVENARRLVALTKAIESLR